MPRLSKSIASEKKPGQRKSKKAAGRPAAKTFINVQVKTSTRSYLNQLKEITGLHTQGEILDLLVAHAIKHRPA